MRPSMLQDEWIVPTVAVLKTTGSLFDATNSAVSIDADSIRMTCGSQTRLLRATRESQIEALAWEAVHFMYASIQICPSKLTSFFFPAGCPSRPGVTAVRCPSAESCTIALRCRVAGLEMVHDTRHLSTHHRWFHVYVRRFFLTSWPADGSLVGR